MIRWSRKSLARVIHLLIVILCLPGPVASTEGEAFDPGDRVELFVDAHQIDSMQGVMLRLHEPRTAEVVLRFDQPWEGPVSTYVTVFQDTDLFRMYYRGWPDLDGDQFTCYAESPDGVNWTRPSLGLVDFQGSTENNILLRMPGDAGTHNFAPFRDTRPGIPEDQRYKALGGQPPYAFASGDGVRWRRLDPNPVMSRGAFDSQNVAMNDPQGQGYRAYFRIFENGVRTVATATSEDFLTWSDPVPLSLGDAGRMHLYTNAATPYFRDPHSWFFFPKRFVPDRQGAADTSEPGVSDALFLSSRDGVHVDQTFPEAFLRPGRDRRNWGDRSNMPAWGLVQTGSDEMSIYYTQHYRQESNHLRRGVLRLDGIASAHAAGDGELITRPLKVSGPWLVLNYATSAAGSLQVEIQEIDGTPIPGFGLDESRPAFGDQIAEAYGWDAGPDLSSLEGRQVRLRFRLRDADLFSYRFAR